MPYGYLVPRTLKEGAGELMQHGVVVEVLAEACSLSVEAFRIEKVESGQRPYQGHHIVKLEGEWISERRAFETGTYYVDSAQPLAKLAAYLLEPESDDGLAVWNFFDRYLYESQWAARLGTFPVLRLYAASCAGLSRWRSDSPL